MAASMDSTALTMIGRAMVMRSLTTMLGFGSLVTERYHALSIMGWVTILGMGFCLITSICFLPSLLRKCGGISCRAKGDEGSAFRIR